MSFSELHARYLRDSTFCFEILEVLAQDEAQSHAQGDKAMTYFRFNVVAALWLSSLFLSEVLAEVAPLDVKQVYAKRASWAETMIATRSNWIGLVEGQAKGKLETKDLSQVWGQITEDWSDQCAWFQNDLPGPRHLEWFQHQDTLSVEEGILKGRLSRLGPLAAEGEKEFEELKLSKAQSQDPRWLDLFGRTCRMDEVVGTCKRIWLGEVRRVVEQHAADFSRDKAPSEDPRWMSLKDLAGQCASGPAAHPGSIAELRPAVELLASRLAQPESMLKSLDKAEPRWRGVLDNALKQNADALTQLPRLCREVRGLRQSLLRSLRGMTDFLVTWSQVGLEQEWENQFATLCHDLGNRTAFEKVASETFRPESLILPGDRDPADIVLRRTEALQAHLCPSDSETALLDLRKAADSVEPTNNEARYLLFVEACRLRRQIAFSNPRLDFDRLLFLKRHLAILDHMCDQFYGIAARPGGALCVLDSPFTPNARVRNLLGDRLVERGRLKGERLSGGPKRKWNIQYDGMGTLSGGETEGGSFLSPDVSYDGKQILFAYVECRGDRQHRAHTDPSLGHWAEGRCYHVFKVNADGSSLEQLTDGTWNDFDPCFMPSGRIAFISERRGGYLRCGRVCPTYTVYDMAADGSDIRCLSFHETNEWQPSVGHDGLILYTRWDYVDRHSMVAHHPWVITPDGRDPRAVLGNYTPRESRPDLEQDVRAIPGSSKFVATAAAHHGQAFGSLVILDPRVVDDERMSAVKRLTPDVGFPESQRGTWAYGEAWPLSEDYHLCAYNPAAELPELGTKGAYGLYLVDSFGNKELVYRDPEIGCHSPMPLAPRPSPPALNELVSQPPSSQSAEATVGIANVYHSRKPWPQGTTITALRVLQVLPLSVSSVASPNTGLQIPNSSSINIARAVLGTVPVEEDGSAYFTVPAGKEVFFQALDQDGLAVTSMRSGTQFQHGENATCQGCHEPRYGAPPSQSRSPLAMRRSPSRLQPDVDGTNPFSYPRLVQPVLEKRCVGCHTQYPGKAPSLDASLVLRPSGAYMDQPTTYYASYLSLTPKFGFYSYGDDLNTIPGKFGARAAPLWQMLSKGHHEVNLTPDESHRISVWLDCLSVFYGVYEKEGTEAQLRGEVVRPTLE